MLNEIFKGNDFLSKLMSEVWRAKLKILFVTVSVSTISVLYIVSMPNIYRAEALVSPAQNDENGLRGLTSGLGGLASLAGVSLSPGGSNDKVKLAIEVLKTREFFTKFISEYDVLVPLMASKSWDERENKLVIDPEVYDVSKKQWVRDVSYPKKPEPSVLEAHDEFLKLLIVKTNPESGLITISIQHLSPELAKVWVDGLISLINSEVRKQDVEQAKRSISYLEEQIAQTKITDLQAGIAVMIQSQIETIMLANATEEYIFKTIDKAVIPEEKIKPKRALLCVLVFILSFMLSLVMPMIRALVKIKNH